MISKFFIDRPIFAAVLSIVITLAGGIAMTTLPIALYPPIAPPTVQVDCTYPGASAQVVSETVATPIEQQVNGVEDMLYMSSQCTNDGAYNLTVTFKHGIDLNVAQVLVQNRVSLAVPLLPDVIKQTGVNVKKKAPDILLAIAVTSPDGRYDQLYLSNYALMRIKDELARLPGVSDVTMLGQRDYSMRIWLDPEKLAARDVTAADVANVLRRQNMQVATGQIGQEPVPEGQTIQIPLSTLGRLVEPEQFGEVVVKSDRNGRLLRVRDLARVELGAKNQDIASKVNGQPNAGLAVFQLPDANALDCADIVKGKMEELKSQFPQGMDYEVRYDTTPFIRESIDRVFETLQEAIMLVAIVVLVFLQNWRSAIIPLVAVPVAIVGTFAVLAAFGFSLNNLTLFGLVLAIGIVVDDAIVVVESAEHHIEHGMAPRDATVQAMEEVSGPVIAIGLVLTAVFVPCMFISGIVGQFFRQFALTIAVSTVISAFNSLTLSPALAALLLRPRTPESLRAPLPRAAFALLGGYLGWTRLGPVLAPHLGRALSAAVAPGAAGLAGGVPHHSWPASAAGMVAGAALGWVAGWFLNRALGAFFALFNAGFRWATDVYAGVVGLMLRVSVLVLVAYGGLLYLTFWGFTHTPAGFVPSQDMGYLLINVQLPDSTSAERSQAAMDQIEKIARGTPEIPPGAPGYVPKTPGVRFTQTITGQSMLLSANGSNFGSMFVILEPFEQRPDPVVERFFRLLDRPKTEAWLRKTFRLKKQQSLSGEAIQAELRKRFAAQVYDAVITVLGPPPVRGVGRAGGFKLMIEDRGDSGSAMLQGQTENLVDKAKQVPDPNLDIRGLSEDQVVELARRSPAINGLVSVFRANVPQLFVDVNRAECMAKQVGLKDLFDTMRIYLGSLYVNDFNRFGRTWQVVVQADQRFRNRIDDARRLKVRNARGAMVPLGTVADVREVNGPLVLMRYNMYPAAPINGAAALGVSSGQAINIMEQVADRELLRTMSYEWTELAYLELQAGNTAMIVFGFAVAMVFLVLAAQYESWSLPLAIILVVPMCLLSAVVGVMVTKMDINIFTQIGFVVLVGLASKNAILIVEFAKAKREEGVPRRQATLEACTLRLRPIVMTSLAFILGVVPLIVGQGAGSEMRRTLGVTVFSGMLGVTIFGVFLTPVFFFVIDWLGETPFFRSRAVRIAGGIALGLLFLPLSPLVYLARQRKSRGIGRPAPRKPAPLDTELGSDGPVDPRVS